MNSYHYDGTDDDTSTARPPASAWLLINSEDRYLTQDSGFANNPGFPGNDFRIQKSQALLYGLFRRAGVSQVQLQYRVPTIIAGVNDQFILYDDTNQDDYKVSIPAGYYSATTLAAAIQTAVLALTPTNPFTAFQCVYSALTGSLVMTNTGVNMGLRYTTGAPYTDQEKLIWQKTFKTIGGNFSSLDNTGLSLALSTPQLLYTKYIDIVSNRLAKFQKVKDGDTMITNKSDIVCRIYLTAPNTRVDPTLSGGPFDITWDPNTPKHSMWNVSEAIYELDFRLYDEYGDLLYWTPGYNTEFQMSILASES